MPESEVGFGELPGPDQVPYFTGNKDEDHQRQVDPASDVDYDSE